VTCNNDNDYMEDEEFEAQGYCSHLAVPLDTGSIGDGVLTCSHTARRST